MNEIDLVTLVNCIEPQIVGHGIWLKNINRREAELIEEELARREFSVFVLTEEEAKRAGFLSDG